MQAIFTITFIFSCCIFGFAQNSPDINTLFEQAAIYQTKGACNKAVSTIDSTLQLAITAKDSQNEFKANYIKSQLFIYCYSDFEKGYTYSSHTLSSAKESGNPANIAKANNMLGALFYYLTLYEEAITFYEEAAVYANKITFNDTLNVKISSMAYINLCEANIKLAEKKHDSKYYKKALTYLEIVKNLLGEKISQDDSPTIKRIKINLNIYEGLITCMTTNKGTNGLSILKQAISLAKQHNYSILDYYDAYYSCGKCFNHLGEYRNAIDNLSIVATSVANKSSKLEIFTELNIAYFALDSISLAYTSLDQAHQEQTDLKEEQILVLSKLESDRSKAETKLEEQSKLYMALFCASLLLFTLIIIINSHRKNLQENRKLKEANQKVQKAKIDAQTFISILAHQSKGRIDTLKNQVKSFQKKAAPQLENRHQYDLELIEDFTFRLSNTFHNLLVWARPNAGTDLPIQLEKINLEKAFGKCSEFGKEAIKEGKLKGLQVDFELNLQHDIYACQVFTNVIMRNVIENAIKYSKGENVLISSRAATDKLQIIVEDDGDGMPAHKMNEDLFNFDAPLDDDRKVGGFGFKISNKLARQQGGRLEVKQREPQGTTVIITCKKFKPSPNKENMQTN